MNNIKYALSLLLVSSLMVAAQVAPRLQQPVKQCAKTYNINEIVSKLNANFPGRLKDCSANVAKDVAMASVTAARLKKSVEKKDYKAFMKQCAVDGIKKDLPDNFAGTSKILGSLENFMQNILNSASSATGELDPKKLASTIGGMSLDGFLNDVKKSLGTDDCVASATPAVAAAPVAPPVAAPPDTTPIRFVPPPVLPPDPPGGTTATPDAPSAPKSEGYFGIRAGINFSHLYARSKILVKDTNNTTGLITDVEKTVDGTYKDVLGFQVGMVLDMAPIDFLHIQPGLMYILKGTENNGKSVSVHYIEIPLLLSLNVSIIRANVGPYLDIYLFGNDKFFNQDFGLSFGLGTDIGKFYIGALYDYGFINMSSDKNFKVFNRTIGLNIGVNL